MTTEQVIDMVIAICPSIVTIITMIGVILRVIKSFTGLKKQVGTNDERYMRNLSELNEKMSQDIQELNGRMKTVLQENYELKKTLNETLTKIDHIDRRKSK